VTETDMSTSADVPAPMYAVYAPPVGPRRRTGLLIAGVVALVLAVGGGVTALVLLNPGPARQAATAPTTVPAASSSPSAVARDVVQLTAARVSAPYWVTTMATGSNRTSMFTSRPDQ
jgi:hypothetical protein